MNEPTADRDPFEAVAESFLARYRAGERPSIAEYAACHPELAEKIRRLLPALVKAEQDLSVEVDPAPPARGKAEAPSIRLGDYEILREIGRGGMGVVYEAEQVSLGRRVALKVLPRQVARDARTLERFRREAKAAARLHHTNIVPVFEVGQDGETAYYAMQFIQGQGLDEVIDELGRLRHDGRTRAAVRSGSTAVAEAAGPLTHAIGSVAASLLTGRLVTEGAASSPPATTDPAATERLEPAAAPHPTTTAASLVDYLPAPGPSSSGVLPGGTLITTTALSGRRAPYFRSVAQIGRQTAQGLAYAHARGIVHRDIKPSNLLLDHAGVVWIADFGLAKAGDDGLTETGDLLGTLRYMAPERFRGEGDARADIYALGLTLYELMALRPAFQTSDRLKLIERIKNEEPARPRSLDGRIPRDLETIVLKAIEKDLKARYQTAEAMGDDLARFLADEPIKARQVSAAERCWRWARRNPVIAALGGMLMAVLFAVTVGSLVTATHFRSLAGRESRSNVQSQQAQRIAVASQKVAETAQEQALLERDKSRRLSAGLALDKGIALAQEGHAGRGLLWMLEALKTAPDDQEAFRKIVRWNVGAWLGQVHKTLRIIETGGPCDYLGFSPDGRSFATGSNHRDRLFETPIDFWDTASGRKLSSLPGAFAPFAFRPDGKVLVAHDDQRRVVAIDLIAGRVLWTTLQTLGVLGLKIDFSPDDSTVLVTSVGSDEDCWLRRLDARTGQQRGEPIRSKRGWVAVAPDGRTVAARRVEAGKAHIDVLDLASGRRMASWPAAENFLYALLFSPDARSLFVSEMKSGVLNQDSQFGRIWDPNTGRPMTPPMMSTTTAIYTPSADQLVTHTHNLWVVRDAENGQVRGSGLHAGMEEFLASEPGGRMMIAASQNNVRLWQVSPDAERVPDGGTDAQTLMKEVEPGRRTRDVRLFSTGLSTDGQIAIAPAKGAGGRALILLVDPTTGRPLGRPASHYPDWRVRSLALSPDGRSFATGSAPAQAAGEVRIWETSTGRLRFPPMPQINYIAALAFQPDGKVLASGDYSGQVRLWDTSTGSEIGRPLPQSEIVMSLAFSPDGTMLAVGLANDYTGKAGVRLWDTRTRQPIGKLLPSADRVTRVKFGPDGRTLLADTQGSTIQLWEVPRGQAIGGPMIEEGSGGFRPDGRAFLTVGSDGTVRLRDAATGAVLGSLLSGSSRATCAAFSGDGGLVVAGFGDGTVRLCDPATSQPVGPPRSMRHGVHHVAFTPDGRTVAATDEFDASRTCPVPELLPDESIDDLTLRIEARIGLRMEPGLAIAPLDNSAWRDRLDRLRRRDPAALRPDEDPAWHEPMIREAEQNGHAFATLWHLDRLIAARPDNWYLHARRARAWSLSDRFDKAADDYQQAERLGSREQVLDFQIYCVVDCTEAGRWAEALWYLDRLIAARPDDGALREDRAAVYGKLGREVDRQAELARVFELGADQGMVIPRAEELGRAVRWADAAGLLARCGRTGPLSRELAQAWVIACLKAGDRAGYREACAAILACQTPDPTVVWNALAASSLFALGSEGLDDYQVAMGWCEKVLSAVPAYQPPVRHLFASTLGGLLLRAGRVDEAIVRLNDEIAAGAGGNLTDWAYLAMARAEKGNFAEARRLLERLHAAGPDPSASFWDIQELALLRSGAESLLFDAEFPSDPFQSRGPR